MKGWYRAGGNVNKKERTDELSYLAPPPMPAPVVVHKDVGGLVTDYQAQTAVYRATGREVRLHECRSACTLALALPNVCVYPDSILKFHQAFDPRTRQADETVSQQLFDSYPAAVRARLGGLTRDYRILRGSELIALGIRSCSEPRTLIAAVTEPRKLPAPRSRTEAPAADPGSIIDGLVQGVMSVLGQSVAPAPSSGAQLAAAPGNAMAVGKAASTVPMPPVRPPEFGSRSYASLAPASEVASPPGAPHGDIALPPQVQSRTLADAEEAPVVISGAPAILPARFSAYTTAR